jgi:hypothetical protein
MSVDPDWQMTSRAASGWLMQHMFTVGMIAWHVSMTKEMVPGVPCLLWPEFIDPSPRAFASLFPGIYEKSSQQRL